MRGWAGVTRWGIRHRECQARRAGTVQDAHAAGPPHRWLPSKSRHAQSGAAEPGPLRPPARMRIRRDARGLGARQTLRRSQNKNQTSECPGRPGRRQSGEIDYMPTPAQWAAGHAEGVPHSARCFHQLTFRPAPEGGPTRRDRSRPVRPTRHASWAAHQQRTLTAGFHALAAPMRRADTVKQDSEQSRKLPPPHSDTRIP